MRKLGIASHLARNPGEGGSLAKENKRRKDMALWELVILNLLVWLILFM